MLPHSFFWGHLLVVGKLMARYPRDLSGQQMPYLLTKEYPELTACGLIYLDTWPISGPMLAVFHPDMMAQFTQETSLPKHKMLRREFGPLTQCHDLLTMEGQEWKMWRSIFNPGFSVRNLTTLLPVFLEEVQVLKDGLVKAAKSGEVVELESYLQKGTIDVICRAAL
jgi:cytochrome P450